MMQATKSRYATVQGCFEGQLRREADALNREDEKFSAYCREKCRLCKRSAPAPARVGASFPFPPFCAHHSFSQRHPREKSTTLPIHLTQAAIYSVQSTYHLYSSNWVSLVTARPRDRLSPSSSPLPQLTMTMIARNCSSAQSMMGLGGLLDRINTLRGTPLDPYDCLHRCLVLAAVPIRVGLLQLGLRLDIRLSGRCKASMLVDVEKRRHRLWKSTGYLGPITLGAIGTATTT
ncbi:hypothetical protein CALVIDRAFT_538149 [Calocera viscosa TUFC12733]|uniref:Uncharacterized protein n=1 Tax=Calocera viscosa (strain TUFC12733) TaxID=1330018 RepID=A0A167L611_CALVF|nr:hypothetical protein CALVIDRAFT_538149 [Calocera viscosa TUFC12733]